MILLVIEIPSPKGQVGRKLRLTVKEAVVRDFWPFLFHESYSHPPLAPDEHLKNFRLFFYFKDAISILCRDETPSEGVVNDYSNKTPNRRSQRLQ